ncbi:MAG: chemotaxis response regulator protein-glutamate methylesterase [Spartobacteria bacterium]|nr:chemotaxis response regulator protein-glutamate methylesterase [Spartobacteria bacterium]
MAINRKVRVMVVDDMALIRDLLARGLAQDPAIEVVGTASDPYIAAKNIPKLKPDVLTLDVEMPRMDGVDFLKKLMPQYPLPVVMVSALTERGKQITLAALEAGAVDFVSKPSVDVARGLNAMMMELRTKVKIASTANVSHWKHHRYETVVKKAEHAGARTYTRALAESTDKVIAIGASTGGTEAIKEVITKFPSTTAGVVIVQHMPGGFTRMFADRLNQLCAMDVKEAEDGDRIMPGRILVAPGGYQCRVVRSGGIYQVDIKAGATVCGHCPSVEVMMQSVAQQVGANAVGVMLTGMGHDGADGMKAMRDAGARTMAQDEQSCVVYGMPKEAYIRGGAEKLVPLKDIADTVMKLLDIRS